MKYTAIPWKHYLTRPMQFLTLLQLAKNFKGTYLQKNVGFGHTRWLFTNRGEKTFSIFLDENETKRGEQFFGKLIHDTPKVKKLFLRGRLSIEEIHNIILKYKTRTYPILSHDELIREYSKAIAIFIQYFAFSVEVPYFIGNIVGNRYSAKSTAYRWILKECEWFRSQSHYPDFDRYVASYFFRSISKSTNVSSKVIQSATHQEIMDLLTGVLTSEQLIKRVTSRKSGFLCYCVSGKEQFIINQKFLSTFYSRKEGVTLLFGKTAQKGVATGLSFQKMNLGSLKKGKY